MGSEFYTAFEFKSPQVGFYARVYGPFTNDDAAYNCLSVIVEKSNAELQARIIEGQENLNDWGNGKSDYALTNLTDKRRLPEPTGDLDPRFPTTSDLLRLIQSVRHIDSRSFDSETGEATEHAWKVYQE